MKVSDLIALLQSMPQDIDVHCSSGISSYDTIKVEHRDSVDHNGKIREFASLTRSNCGHEGLPHFSEDEYQKQAKEVLRKLSAEAWRGGHYAYTEIHGDQRIYMPTGSQNATCYGTAYDPRTWSRLIAEGLLERIKYGYSVSMIVTEAGREAAKGAIEAAAT